MNKLTDRQKEVIQYELDSEKDVLKQLEKHYQTALNDIDRRIRILESDELTQSRIYRIEYQKALRKQVEATLEKLHADEYATIQGFLSDSYTTGFVGAAYDMFGQGVPLIMPIDKNAAVKAVITDSKIDVSLYDALGVDTNKLKKTITAEITRGLAGGLPHSEISRNLSNAAKISLGRAKTIVRTEAHRIQEASAQDARVTAVNEGASVVKQWKAIMDGKVRHSHRLLDGQIVEVDKPFELDGMEAMYPGDFGNAAMDCNCRCRATQRARIAMNEDEYKKLQERARFFGLMEEDSEEFGHEKERVVFSDFKKKYLKASENEKILLEKSEKSGKIKMGNTDVRKWYLGEVSKIRDSIDQTLPIKEQAKQAFEARNRIRTEARNMMADEATRKKLDKERPNKTFEELIESKMKRKGMTREEAILDILETATKTNENVNKELGLGDD